MTLPNAWARHHCQGTPGTCSSSRINKQAPKYYAHPRDGFPVTSGGTTAITKGGQTPKGNVAEQPPLVRQLSFANPLAVPAGNSVSSLSQSTKTSSKGKRDGPTITNPYTKKTRSEPSQKSHSGGMKIDSPDNDEDEKKLDCVPVTNKGINNIMEGKGTWEEDTITAQHRKAFYMKAFPPVNPHEQFDKPQSKSASMTLCRPKTEVDYIKYVIQHWEKGTVIRNMEDGEEKKRLLNFCQKNKLGQKYIHQYYLQEVLAPGDLEPCQVLRRLELNKEEGRIVISREELFNAINEWHHLNGHLG
jgi:hypothetical protein